MADLGGERGARSQVRCAARPAYQALRGAGIGLYEIREDLSWRLHPESVTGTFANRLVHWESDQVFIDPHAIDAKGEVRTIEARQPVRARVLAGAVRG